MVVTSSADDSHGRVGEDEEKKIAWAGIAQHFLEMSLLRLVLKGFCPRRKSRSSALAPHMRIAPCSPCEGTDLKSPCTT